MSTSRIALRYAKPILELAKEKKVLDAVKGDMEAFSMLCKESRELGLMLKSPIIPNLRKAELLTRIFKGNVNDMTLQVFNIVTRKNRENLLEEIAEEFLQLYNIDKGLSEIAVTTSIKLDGKQRKEFEEIAKKLTDKEPILKEVVDPSMIGGYIMKIGDRRIDQSISGQLKNIRLKLRVN